MSAPRLSCAFCSPSGFANKFRPGVSSSIAQTSTYQVRRYCGFAPACPVRQSRPGATQKRARSVWKPPTCTFGNNSNNSNDKFLSQAADVLLNAGRFFQTSTGQIVLWGGLVWLVLTGRIGFLFDSFLFLFAVFTILPVLAMVTFRWWVGRQVVQGTCPSCGAQVTGLRNQTFQCMNCGNTVQGEDAGNFSVKDPSSATIDIDAKEVDDL